MKQASFRVSDVHRRSSTYCLLDGYGQVVETRTVRGRGPKLIDQLAKWQQPMQVIYEASLGYGTIHQRLSSFCRRVVVAHPKKMKWIFCSRQKNDKVDAAGGIAYRSEAGVPRLGRHGKSVKSWSSPFRVTLTLAGGREP